MGEQWQYQLRIYLADELAKAVRGDPAALGLLPGVLEKHSATMKCQLDAFTDYVAEAEAHGVEAYPLYAWTKATIEDPVKRAKHFRSFALHIKAEAVYPKQAADALEADLQPVVDGTSIVRISRHDTNPANNQPVPERYRQSQA
jgi:hypothetical protein